MFSSSALYLGQVEGMTNKDGSDTWRREGHILLCEYNMVHEKLRVI